MDTSTLEDLGLSHAEATLYLTLLEGGPSTTGPLIYDTGLQSSTVYHVLGSLQEKGLVSYILRGKTKHFQAESPESFALFLDEKRQRLEKILPKLRRMETQRKTKHTARVFEGLNGMKTAMNDILLTMKPGEEYYFLSVPSHNFSTQDVQRFFRQYHLRRDSLGIRVKGITTKDNIQQMKRVHRGLRHSQVRWVNDFLTIGLVIYNNKVITMDFDSMTAFMIQSPFVAKSYARFFKEKWKSARR